MDSVSTLFNNFDKFKSVMEDDAIPNDANDDIQLSDAVETISDKTEHAFETAELTENITNSVNAIEMLSTHYDETDRMISHVENYGIDRSFLSLMNYDNRLSRSLGISFPACESFDTVGNSYSSEAIAAMEGLGDILQGIWNFIKGIFKKIIDFFKRLFGINDSSLDKQEHTIDIIYGETTEIQKAKQKLLDRTANILNKLMSDGATSLIDLGSIDSLTKEFNSTYQEIYSSCQKAVPIIEDNVRRLKDSSTTDLPAIKDTDELKGSIKKNLELSKSFSERIANAIKEDEISDPKNILQTIKNDCQIMKRFIHDNRKQNDELKQLTSKLESVQNNLTSADSIIKKYSDSNTLQNDVTPKRIRALFNKIKESVTDLSRLVSQLANIMKSAEELRRRMILTSRKIIHLIIHENGIHKVKKEAQELGILEPDESNASPDSV